MKKVNKIEDKLKFRAFGKTKPKTEKKVAATKKKTDEEILKEQAKRLEEDILKVKEDTKGKVSRVFAMKKQLNGGKKEAQEPVAVRDPDTNELVVAAEEIKKVTINYCEANLKKNKENNKVKEECQRMRMMEKDEE